MALQHRTSVHPATVPSMLRYSHMQAGTGYAPSFAGSKPNIPGHTPTMGHMLPQQSLSQTMRMPQPRSEVDSISVYNGLAATHPPHDVSSPADGQLGDNRLGRDVTALRSIRQDEHRSVPQPPCFRSAHAPTSPMTTLFDSITSAYDPPEVEAGGDDSAGEGAMTNAQSSLRSTTACGEQSKLQKQWTYCIKQ